MNAPLKIVIIVPKLNHCYQKDYNYTFPIGPAYLSSYLKSNGKYVNAFNLNHYDGHPDKILQTNSNLYRDADLILVGGMESHFLQIKQIIKTIKEISQAKITIGGPLLNGENHSIFKATHADFGIIGEGEIALLQLVEYLEEKIPIDEVPSLIYYQKGVIKTSSRAEQIHDISSLPLPDFDAFDFNEYLDNTNSNAMFYSCIIDNPRIYPLCGSRGCRYNCTFCTQTFGKKYITRSMDSIFFELQKNIEKYKINIVFVIDDLIGDSKERITEFCHRFASLRQRIDSNCVWWANITAKNLDKEMLSLLEYSGCFLISLGYESYSETILRSMKKPITPKDIERSLQQIIEYKNVSLQANFMYGDIAETKKTINETLKFIKEKAQGQVEVLSIVPSFGSQLFKDLQAHNIVKSPIDHAKKMARRFDKRNIFMAQRPPKISKTQHYFIMRKIQIYRHRYYKKAVVSFKKGSFSFKCPECQTIQKYNNVKYSNTISFFYSGICRNCKTRISFLSKTHRLFAFMLPLIYDLWYIFKSIKYFIHEKVWSESKTF